MQTGVLQLHNCGCLDKLILCTLIYKATRLDVCMQTCTSLFHLNKHTFVIQNERPSF